MESGRGSFTPGGVPTIQATPDSARSGNLSQRDSARGGNESARDSGRTPTEPTIFVSNQAELQGRIVFGDGCIVHPKCTILAEAGDIVFGNYCIIEERCKISNLYKRDEQGKPIKIKREMKIGNYNVFEAGAMVENTDIGDMNEF